jgi:hypothetical protein
MLQGYQGDWSMLKETLRGYHGMDFLKPLVKDMVQDDPSKRPTMPEVLERFEKIVGSMTKSQLLKRAVRRTEPGHETLFKNISHAWWKMKVSMRGLPAIPTPPPLH